MKRPELLLPVGTREMLTAAINNGADAVYFGVPHWNARGRSEDFTFEDVEEMILYARKRGVRTFLAMNVLVFEREICDLPKFLEQLISLKPDAFIIQDIGLARLIRAIAPNQEIHASTQMTLSSAEGIGLVKSLGFNRAVLARELSLKEIAAIKASTDLELEVFIHGALCVSYSGQCLTSENFGGRSANRGQCAQSCRLPYRIFVDGREYLDTDAKYLFSPHDLCALPKLKDLEDIGVDSLKVEGRLKSPEYVAAVSKAYRKALNDQPLQDKDTEPLEVLFSRGLRTGWLEGDDHQKLVDGTFSNHHGQFLGLVAKTSGGGITVELIPGTNLPQLGDGILFENPKQDIGVGARLFGIKSSAKDGTILLTFGRDFDTRKVTSGMKCYRNDSPALERELRKSFTEREHMKRTPVSMVLSGTIGKPLQLQLQDDKHNTVLVESENILEESRSQNDNANSLLRELAQKELSALSGTAYRLESLSVDIAPEAFVPGKWLRTLRQSAVEKLDTQRCNWIPLKPNAQDGIHLLDTTRTKFKSSASIQAESAHPVISVLVRNPDQIAALQGLPIQNVIMDFDWGVKYEKPLQQIRELGFKAGMATLRIHKPGENHYLKNILRLAPDFALVRNLGALSLLRESGIPLAGDYSLNAANSLSFDWLLSQGLATLHPSWDLNSAQLFDLLENIDASKLELTLHQYMPAFHSEYCAFARALTTGRRFPECGKICTQHKVEILDHKGERHFLQSDAECRNTLFVGKPQSALKLLPNLCKAGVYHFRIEMLQENAEIVRQKASIYTQAILGKISIEEAVQQAGVQEKYGLSDGQLFNETIWEDRKK